MIILKCLMVIVSLINNASLASTALPNNVDANIKESVSLNLEDNERAYRLIVSNYDKVISAEILFYENYCIAALITEPIYFYSDIKSLLQSVKNTLSAVYSGYNIYVTKDVDIYSRIRKCNREYDHILCEQIVNKVLSRHNHN